MEYKPKSQSLQIKQNNLSNPVEKARILRKYAGIFPDNIVEFGNKVIKKMKSQKNYSR